MGGFFGRDELFIAAKYQMHPWQVNDTTEKQFVRRVRARLILARWHLHCPSAYEKVKLSKDEACLQKVSKNDWDVFASACLRGAELIGNETRLQCKIRIDHMDTDAPGLIFGAVGGKSHKVSDTVGIHG